MRLLDWVQSVGLVQADTYKKYLNIVPCKNECFINLSDLSETRSNVCLVTALALKLGKVYFKGTKGCGFTDRKVDRHFALMDAFGLKVREVDNLYEVVRPESSNDVNFNCSTEKYGSSVGVTCHALIASLIYPNKITLTNAALEPAPMTLVKFIKNSTNRSVDINGKTITINAINYIEHKKNEIELPPDITVASTFIAALVATGKGEIELDNISLLDIPLSVLDVFKKMGIDVSEISTKKLKFSICNTNLSIPKNIVCDVSPGFPTDIAPIIAAAIAGINRTTVITDTVYDSRSSHVEGLNKMGYELTTKDNSIIVYGHLPEKRKEIVVAAPDIRAGAALIVGALGSNAESVKITDFKQIYRGYAHIIEDLQKLGANIVQN